MIDNSVDYRGVKVDKMALEFDKVMVDDYIDKLYQPERLSPEDATKIMDEIENHFRKFYGICDSPNSEYK